jgi:hypothetical protein
VGGWGDRSRGGGGFCSKDQFMVTANRQQLWNWWGWAVGLGGGHGYALVPPPEGGGECTGVIFSGEGGSGHRLWGDGGCLSRPGPSCWM